MIKQDVFDRLLEIGGPPLASRVIELFFEHMPQKVASLSESFAQGDYKTIERTAHAIKSSAANLGLEDLKQIAASLEQLAHRGELPPCGPLIPELVSAYELANTLLRDKQKELETA